MIDYYSKRFGLKSVRIVMQSGGPLQIPEHFDLMGYEIITGAHARDIRIDIPGIGSFSH